MKTRKKLVSVIVTSCVALFLCLALLAGSTFAWFTDTVVSSGNIIKAGNINVDGTVYYETSTDGVTVKQTVNENTGDFTITPIVSTYDMVHSDGECDDSDKIGTDLYGYDSRTLSFDLSESADVGNLNQPGAISGTHSKDEPLAVEPGQSYARLIKLENTGSIDAVAKFNFSGNGDLLNEMWFYLAEVSYDETNTDAPLTIGSNEEFTPESIDEINDLEDSGLTKEFPLAAEAAEDKWVVLVFGVFASAGNSVQGQNLDLTMTVLATQNVGHTKTDGSPVAADYAEWTGVTDTSWIPSDMGGIKTADGEYVKNGDHTGETYTIYTPAQLGGLAYYCNHYQRAFTDVTVKLGADMDLGNCEWTPIGLRHADEAESGTTNDNGNGSWHGFFGDFDGANYTIYNLTVREGHEHASEYDESTGTWESNGNYAGLFGRLWGGKIENVTIHNADVKGSQSVGVLAGTASAGTTSGTSYTDNEYEYDEESGTIHTSISNCHVEGLIKVEADHEAGGLIGHASDVHIENCSVKGISGSYVKSEYNETLMEEDPDGDHDGDNAGGLVGFMGTTAATNYYSYPNGYDGTGESTGDTSNYYLAVADVVPVKGCSVSGLTVSGTRKVGGIIGYGQCMIKMSDCSVSDCDIKLVYNAGATLSGTSIKTGKLFVGAFVGEYNMTVAVSGKMTVSGTTVSYFEKTSAGFAPVGADTGYRGKTQSGVNTEGLFGGCRSTYLSNAEVTDTDSVLFGITVTTIDLSGTIPA